MLEVFDSMCSEILENQELSAAGKEKLLTALLRALHYEEVMEDNLIKESAYYNDKLVRKALENIAPGEHEED